MEKSVSIKVKNYFEGNVYFLGWMLLLSCVFVFIINWIVAVIVAFIGGLIVSSHYKLIIDKEKKIVHDQLLLLGLKNKHESFKFKQLKHIIINEAKFSQKMQLRAASGSMTGMLYSAYLVCDDKKHFLGESQNLAKLKVKAEDLANQLGIEVKDRSK